jgi:hypothetical protein
VHTLSAEERKTLLKGVDRKRRVHVEIAEKDSVFPGRRPCASRLHQRRCKCLIGDLSVDLRMASTEDEPQDDRGEEQEASQGRNDSLEQLHVVDGASRRPRASAWNGPWGAVNALTPMKIKRKIAATVPCSPMRG